MRHGDSVVLLIGDDDYLKNKAIENIRSSLVDSSSRELDYKVFYGQDADTDEILGYVATAPFISPRRVAVIKGFDRMPSDSRARIFAYAKKPSKSACLVLEARDDSALGGYGVSAENMTVRRFGALSDEKARSWITAFMATGKKKIDPDAVSALMELRGRDLSSLSRELEKLTAFAGERDTVKAKDVEEVVGRTLTASAFNLTDAIEKGDARAAMRTLGDLLITGKRHQEIIGLLCWYMKKIIRAKSLKAAGKSGAFMAEALGTSRERAEKLLRRADGMTDSQIKGKIDVLLEADMDIKRTRFNPTLVLECAVIRLCLSGT